MHHNRTHRKNEFTNEKSMKKQATFYRGTLKCGECQKVFKSKSTFTDHVNAIHKGLKNHQCDKCQQVFGYRENLQLHHVSFHQ